jgi:hypothetical protein
MRIFDWIKTFIVEKWCPLVLQLFGLEHLLLPFVSECFCLNYTKFNYLLNLESVFRYAAIEPETDSCAESNPSERVSVLAYGEIIFVGK